MKFQTMPPQRRRHLPSPQRVNWERRRGGRLLRLGRPAHFVDSEVMVYDIDTVNERTVKAHTVEQRVPPLPSMLEDDMESSFDFCSLARHDVLDNIIAYLSIKEMEALRDVNSWLKNYIDTKLVVRLSLPLPQETASRLGGRRILALSSCCNLAWLPGIHTFGPFTQLNLTQLRELKLTGKNLDLMIEMEKCLSSTYHHSLSYILNHLSKTSTLQKLEILTDSTDKTLETAKLIKNLVNLEELVLHGIGHFNNTASYSIDTNMANRVIVEAMLNTRIRTLKLVKFETGEFPRNELFLKSDTLKELAILESKVTKIRALDLPSLITLETDISSITFDMAISKRWFKDLKRLVFKSCPKLETWNSQDLLKLSKKAGGGKWIEELKLNSEQEGVDDESIY